MTHSFMAFIDESGDDGLGKYRVPGGIGGASHWLVLSATVIRRSNSLEAVSWRNEILARLGKAKAPLHFVNLNHSQRIVAAECLADKPVRLINILAAKKPIPDGLYREKNQFYFDMARYLIERISWLCRDIRPRVPEGDGRTSIMFSRRGGMSYENFRSYLTKLKAAGPSGSSIHWPVIDLDAVDAQDHSRHASLQLADIAASSFAAAVELDRYGNCEDRYALTLRKVAYNRDGNYLSYGIKFVPDPDQCGLSVKQLQFLQRLNEQPPGS